MPEDKDKPESTSRSSVRPSAAGAVKAKKAEVAEKKPALKRASLYPGVITKE
jgi:hypothetical protein